MNIKRFIRLVLLSGLLGICLSIEAVADNLVITTGRTGGGYHSIGEILQQHLQRRELSSKVMTSVGSLENLTRLDDPSHSANIGLTQADALQYYINSHPSFSNKVLILSDIGKECVFIIAGTKTGIKEGYDLQKQQDNVLAIHSAESGMAVTYQYMSYLEPKLQNTKVTYLDSLEALQQIRQGNRIKAVMLVMHPKAMFPELKEALLNPKHYQFVNINDWDLNDSLPNGDSVYTFEDITLRGNIKTENTRGMSAALGQKYFAEVETICTQGLIIAVKNKLSKAQQASLILVTPQASKRYRLYGD